MKICPFCKDKCDENCALYISYDDLNEFMVSKLSSLGVMKNNSGICSFKILSLSQARHIFENTNTNRRF